MKKMTAILLTILLMLSALTGMLAEGTATDLPEDMNVHNERDPFTSELTGLVVGFEKDGTLLIRHDEGALYLVQILDGYTDMVDAQGLQLGDYVTVLYDGMLTRSVPARLTASYISCFKRTGEIIAVDAGGFTMMTEDGETLQVWVDEELLSAPLTEGAVIEVYFNGMMSRSIPAQITALYLRTVDFYGMVISIDEDESSLVLLNQNDEEIIVHVADETIVYTDVEEGMMVCVASTGMMTMSIPAQIVALEILPMAEAAME